MWFLAPRHILGFGTSSMMENLSWFLGRCLEKGGMIISWMESTLCVLRVSSGYGLLQVFRFTAVWTWLNVISSDWCWCNCAACIVLYMILFIREQFMCLMRKGRVRKHKSDIWLNHLFDDPENKLRNPFTRLTTHMQRNETLWGSRGGNESFPF